MIKLSSSVCIDAPAAAVWARLADLPGIQEWSEAVLHAHIASDISQGVGAERVCQIPGNQTIRERWLEWDEGHSYTYEGRGVPMMKRAVNRWSVVAQNGKSILTSEAELELQGGVLGKLLEPFVAPLIKKMSANALAPFKYYVEHGHPYAGKSSELPQASATC